MNKKREFRYFTIMDYEREQDYLREQHRQGWRFTHVSGLGMYHFEACEPEDVVYQLDYNQEGLAHKEEYVRLFQDCGWEYLQDYVGYSYFRKPAADMGSEEGIFCDDASRLAMMQRVFRGRLVPLLVLFCAVLVPQFLLQLTTGRYVLAVVYSLILLLYIAIFLWFFKKYTDYKNSSQR